MRRNFLCLLATLWAWTPWLASGQGVLVLTHEYRRLPRPLQLAPAQPAMTYKIKEIAVQGRILDQTARVEVSQSFVNTGSLPLEVQFLFPLPYDGAIDRLTLMVDGQELPGQLLSAADARAKYEAIVRSSRDPALLEWVGQGMFQTNVFPVPAGQERKVSLHYNQLLKKESSLTDFLFPLSMAKYTSTPVEKISFQLSIESTIPIKSVYSPTHAVDVKRSDDLHAQVSFVRTNEVPSSDFRLFFDTEKGKLGASVLTYRPKADEDGYFLLLASPQVLEKQAQAISKTVLFTLDKSGSMTGVKIEQARSALNFVLNNLREGDLFNIVTYDSEVESFRPELQIYNNQTRDAALSYVEGVHPGSGTNIHDALKTSLAFLKDSRQPNFVMFLTDGLPTIGEQNEGKIAAATKHANLVRARLLTFGVGNDVNSRLLDRLAHDNGGSSEYVRPNEDIEAHVSRVYKHISAPVLTGIELHYQFDVPPSATAAPAVNRVYPKQTIDLFSGEQLVLVGRYHSTGPAKVVVKGQVGMETQQFDFPANFVEKSVDQSYSFVEKIWAMRRIGEIIDEIDLHGKNEELVQELVRLATKHGILTPYTSFLAEETSRPSLMTSDVKANSLSADRELKQLDVTNGALGVEQRISKGEYSKADRLREHKGRNITIGNGYSSGPANLNAPTSPAQLSDTLVSLEQNVRNVGANTLYKRGKRLVTPETAVLDLSKEADKTKVTEITRYTEAYFALVKANSTDENQLLSSQAEDEELLVQLRGQNYLIK